MSNEQTGSTSALEETFGKAAWIDGEIWNGRLAMIGFVTAIALEALTNQSLLPKLW
jgi:hypothetical protein